MRTFTTLALAALALAIALHPRDARACHCSDSPPIASPAGGVVPPNPTIYVFVSNSYVKMDFDGGSVENAESTSYVVARSPAYEVWRHDVKKSSGTFKLHVPLAGDIEYRIGTTSPNQASIVAVGKNGDLANSHGCGSHVAIDLETTGTAIAYRVAWSDGTSSVLKPYSNYANRETSLAWIGLSGCNETDWNVQGMDTLRAFTLFALFADGSEHRLGASSARLGPSGFRIPNELFGAKLEPPVTREPAPIVNMMVVAPWPMQMAAAAAGAFASALLVLVGLALVKRRRDHRPRT